MPDRTPEEKLYAIKEIVKEQVRETIDEFREANPDMNKEDTRNRLDYDGRITEIYDSAVPIYSSTIMELGSLVEVYNHENELGPAFDGTPTALNIIAGSIYEILSEVAWEEIDEHLDEIFEDE